MLPPYVLEGLPKPIASMVATPASVGQFVMDWAKVEYGVIALMTVTENAEYFELRAKFLAQAANQAAYLCAALKKTDTPHAAIVEEKFRKLKEFRNDIVHGFWKGVDDNGDWHLQRVLKGNVTEIQNVTFGYIHAGVVAAQDLAADLFAVKRLFLQRDAPFEGCFQPLQLPPKNVVLRDVFDASN